MRVAGFLAVAVTLLQGCGCWDNVEHFTPASAQLRATWHDPQTLELEFDHALRPAMDVDAGRFALLRYNVAADGGDSYSCYFDFCYRGLAAVATIPDSISWDPAEPELLRLHFAEPIPSSECDAWGSRKAKVQSEPGRFASGPLRGALRAVRI